MPLILFLAFLTVPLVEIGVFIELGGFIGLWPTLAIIVLTAFLGTWLLRQQGLATFSRAQNQMAAGEMPLGEVFHGFVLLFAGALLLTPGFVTDAVGFVLMIPAVREGLRKKLTGFIATHATVTVHTDGVIYPDDPPPRPAAPHETVIEGDFEVEQDDTHPPKPDQV